jgi:hypothetical protein
MLMICKNRYNVYCLSDDILTSMGWHDDQQQTMSTAEVMTVALTAAAFFSGNYERSREFLKQSLQCFQKASLTVA